MKNDARGWVFTPETSLKEIGFAPAGEYENADCAVAGFSQEYANDFLVFFRDSNGELNPCDAESTPDDFE